MLKNNNKVGCFYTLITYNDTNRHCGTPNPTWKEIRHFVWFLNHQLSACEQSNVIRTVKGLKEFTVKFMIDMSRVNTVIIRKIYVDLNYRILPHHQCLRKMMKIYLSNTFLDKIGSIGKHN